MIIEKTLPFAVKSFSQGLSFQYNQWVSPQGPRMGLVNRYLLRQIAAPAALAVTAIAVVAVANELQERVKRLPVAQMTLGDISRLAFYSLPTLVAYVVPITYMMGILLAFGRLSQNNELVAMKAAGIPLKRILVPVLVVGALLSGACLLVQDRVQPWAIRKVNDLIQFELPLRVTLDVLPTGIMQEFGDWRVYIGGKDLKTNTLENIVILKPEADGRAAAYYAASARLTRDNGQSRLEMTEVNLIPPGQSGYVTPMRTASMWLAVPKPVLDKPLVPHKPVPLRELYGKEQALEQEVAREGSEPLKADLRKVREEINDRLSARRGLTIRELYANQRELTAAVERTSSEPLKLALLKLRRELADRLSLPFACLAVTFAAAPLGARAKRSGRSYTFAMGFIIILVYYVLQMLVMPKSLYPLWWGIVRAWTPNLVLCAVGALFLWRVDRV
jgi:lipopolysaccharide export LptBFGC system permease protein LptF